MKERKNLPTRETTDEDIEGLDYVKTEGLQQLFYKFWLRFISKGFKPCPECQEQLHETISQADNLYLGNKDYLPLITLERHWEVIDKAWKEVERHTATEKDFITIWGEKGKKYWKDHQEAIGEG